MGSGSRLKKGLTTAATQLAKQLSELDLASHPFVMSEQFASLRSSISSISETKKRIKRSGLSSVSS